MIHIIYIYIIINTFLLSIYHDMWNDRMGFRGNAIAFMMIFLFGTFLIVFSTPIDIANYFIKGSGRSILINLKFILFPNFFTPKLLKNTDDLPKCIDMINYAMEQRLKQKKRTFVDWTYIWGARKINSYIKKNNIKIN